MAALAPFDADRRALMRARIERRARRQREHERISFLPADATIGRTSITVSDARAGRFDGGEIPPDLQRQWIQGTGPAARPRTATPESIRNVAYALLSGADGWMFDGEDALGQVDSDVARQPAQPEAGVRAGRRVHDCRRAGRRRDERVGRRASSIAPSSRTGARSWTSRRGSSVRAVSTSTTGTSASRAASPSRPRSSTWRSTSEQPRASCAAKAEASSCICPRFRRPKRRRCGTTCSTRSSGISACREARSRSTCSSSRSKPASSSWRFAPRSARTSSASTPAAGTTSTASRMRRRGIRRSSTRTSTRSR